MKKLLVKRFFQYTAYCILYTVYCTLHPTAKVSAADVSLSVSPPVVEILLSPGKSVSQTFTLQTQGEALPLTPELHLAHPSDSEGHMTIDPNPLTPNSTPLTATIHPAGVTAQLASQAYTLTLEAASTDTPQDIYLALVFKVNPAGAAARLDSRATTTLTGISALVLVTLTPGNLPVNLEIQNFTPPALHDSWDSLTVSPTLQNHAPTMIRPEGKYEVIDPGGQTVFSLPLYPSLILGNSSRSILGSSTNPAGAAQRLDSRALTWSPSWHDLGPYRLRLTITSQGGTQLTQVEKTIWLLPLKLALLTLALLLLLLYLTLLVKHSKFNPV